MRNPFVERFRGGEMLLGSFIKTPTSHAAEILGDIGFDFVVIDEEHAPIDRGDTDQILLGCRAANMAGLVRIAAFSASNILTVLDCGASGILVPQVRSAREAELIAAASRYRGGSRGFSNSPRAGRYGGASMWEHVDAQDKSIACIAMIEDREAVDNIEEILRVSGLDGIFIGRGDLTVSFGAESAGDPIVKGSVSRIIKAARDAGKPVCVMVGGIQEAECFWKEGATAFLVASDQGLMRLGGLKVRADFTDAFS